MKKIILEVGFILTFTCSFVCMTHAQSEADAAYYSEVLWSVQKRDLIGSAMNLSDFEAFVFWPIYESYEEERRGISTKFTLLLNEYLDVQADLSERKSNRFLKRLLKFDTVYDDLYETYYTRVKSKLGAQNAYKFLRLEIYIQNSLRNSLLSRPSELEATTNDQLKEELVNFQASSYFISNITPKTNP
jgi:hypothetical protein